MTLTQRLGIKHPILQAPMAGISTPMLAAEVSNQGAFGALGLGANTVTTARQQIQQTQALTKQPFQINFFCHDSQPLDPHVEQLWLKQFKPLFKKYAAKVPQQLNCIYPSFKDHDEYLNLVLETQPKAVSFHFGIPHAHQIQALKNAGIITMVSATNLAEAQAIEAAGIDMIIAQGIEAGGHRGLFNANFDAAIKSSDLVQLIKQHCHLPVIAAGGIMNGQHAKYMLDLGADAVQLGTAFIQCKSSNASQAYRQALFQQPFTQVSSSISGRPARGLINGWHMLIDTPDRPTVPAYPYAYDLAKQLHTAANQCDDQSYAAFWAGSNVNQIRQIEAPDLINQLVLEMQLD